MSENKQPIRYISGGLLGDFIHQLSVVKELYDKTGRKGVLYISDTARPNEPFTFGLEQVYKDTYPFISVQPYIDSYHIHQNQEYDINLSSWFFNQPLYTNNWKKIFSDEYNINWCSTPYLTFNINEQFKDKILISSSIKRFNKNINYNKLIELLPIKPIFVTSQVEEYHYFKEQTGIELEAYYFKELNDLYSAIYSCKLFIGNLSSPMTIAEACFKPRIYLLQSDYNGIDNIHMIDLDKILSNCYYLFNNNHLYDIEKFIYKYFNKSQFEQDKHVIEFYNKKENGFFVEVGAFDGIESSNSYILEKAYNWKGLCIECNPIYYNKLSKNRKCIINNNAIYNEDNRIMEFYSSGGYAGLVETNQHQHILSDPIIKVKTKKLTTILDEINAPSFIEYLSLDTEGSEYEILKAHDFNKYTFGYICVEHNHIEKNRKLIRKLLENKGYVFVRENGNIQWGVVDDEYKYVGSNFIIENINFKMKILFINHNRSQCGVYNYGKRLYTIWKKSLYLDFDYIEINSLEEYNNILFSNYNYIIYNYHLHTMKWLTKDKINKINKNIGILHECESDLFDYIMDASNDIPRPLFNDIPNKIKSDNEVIINFLEYGKEDNIPIIGSFGFGFKNKGFDKIVNYVCEEFDSAIIKFIIPYSTFGDPLGNEAKYISDICYKMNYKPNIKIMIIHEFLEEDDMLYFLNQNTINLFLYDYMNGRGISSTIDFALSVNKPIGISNSYMFRHIYNDSICIYKQSITYCINHSLFYLQQFKELFSQQNLIKKIEEFFNV
jgi:FkbM family methyltransferase